MFLRTLGGLSLEGASFHRPKPLLLLAYLALEARAERRYLAELFWMEAASARRSLSMALSQLRHSAPGVIGTDEVRVWSEVPCDAALLLRAIEERDWSRAIELYDGPFLQGFEGAGSGVELEEWIYGTREVLAQGVRSAMLALAEMAAGEARFDDAGKLAERARALDATAPPDADALARTFQLLLASGAAGIRAMREEGEALGLTLAPTQEAARGALLSTAPGSRGVTWRSSVPSRTTSFVGRRRELAQLDELLDGSEARLVSIVGSAGTALTPGSLPSVVAAPYGGCATHVTLPDPSHGPGRSIDTFGIHARQLTQRHGRWAFPPLARAFAARLGSSQLGGCVLD